MTPNEYADSLVKEAQEVNFQYDVLVKDVSWIEDKIKELFLKILKSPFTQREENMKELDFLMIKLRISSDAREKLKVKSNNLGAKINEFFGKDLWKDL